MKTTPLSRISRPNPVLTVGFQIAIALIIFGATHLSQTFHFFGRHESFVWFPAGISLGIVQRLGLRTMPAIFAGLAAYYIGVYKLPVWASIWTSTTWSISLLVFYFGLRRYGPRDIIEAPLRSLVAFYLIGVVLTPATHTVLDLPMMILAGLIEPGDDLRTYVFSYWLGEAYSALLLAPSIYLAGQDFKRYYQGPMAVYPNIRREKIIWSAIAFCLLAATYYFGQFHFYAGVQDIEFVLFPMLAWSALRLGVVFTKAAVVIVSFSVFTFTAFGLGGTPAPVTNQTMIALLTFVLTISVMAQLLVVQDLERRLHNAKLAYAATHDWLTDLGNVLSFRNAVTAQIAISKATQRQFALGYIETHEHRALEYGYGIRARNGFLRQLGSFIASGLAADTEIARVSGGNFTVLFKADGIETARDKLGELQRKLTAFRFVWGSKIYRISPKFRIAPVDASVLNADRLLEWISGKTEQPEQIGQVNILSGDTLGAELQERRAQVHWLAEIQEALADNRFLIMAQRIQRIKPATEHRAEPEDRLEILVRMLTKGDQIIPPGLFLPHAERFNLLPRIDQWVFTHAGNWFASRPDCLERTAKISINISGQSLGDPEFRKSLLQYLDNTPIPRTKLCFEITESEAISNLKSAVSFFEDLRATGVSVSLDDFGTGLSSFEYLKRFRVDYLKIDGIFIRMLEVNSHDYAIVKAIQDVANTMNIETVAEFVETDVILACLRELGVNFAQGYAVGKPMTLPRFFGLVSDKNEAARRLELPSAIEDGNQKPA
jgi:EAL domain-containing protein (putative c-di-GMP-specific phosphodiesterase class I)/integral membrane sensor domain MASE1